MMINMVVLKIALTMMKMLYMKIILPILIQGRSFWNVGGVLVWMILIYLVLVFSSDHMKLGCFGFLFHVTVTVDFLSPDECHFAIVKQVNGEIDIGALGKIN